MRQMEEAERKRYIHSQVAQIRPRLRLEPLGQVLKNLKEKDELARFLWTTKGAETFQALRYYSGSHLVQIATCGLGENGGDGEETPLCFMSDELSMKWSGVDIVIKVASAAILAALTDQLWDEMERAKVEAAKPLPKRIKCRFCNFTVIKYRRGEQGTSGWSAMLRHVEMEHPNHYAEFEKFLGEDVTEEV